MKFVIKLPTIHQDGPDKGKPLTVPFRKFELRVAIPGKTRFGFQTRIVSIKEKEKVLCVIRTLSFRNQMKFNIPSNINLELGNPNYTLEINT